MKFLDFNKVLCLSPHPDDVEYGMLGSMMKYKNTIKKVLDRHAESQFNISSVAARELLSEEIARELIKKGQSYKPKRRWERQDSYMDDQFYYDEGF